MLLEARAVVGFRRQSQEDMGKSPHDVECSHSHLFGDLLGEVVAVQALHLIRIENVH